MSKKCEKCRFKDIPKFEKPCAGCLHNSEPRLQYNFEPPQKSAFQEWWNKPWKTTQTAIYDRESAKIGWSAAINAVLNLNQYSIDLCKPGPDQQMICADEINELKEL